MDNIIYKWHWTIFRFYFFLFSPIKIVFFFNLKIKNNYNLNPPLQRSSKYDTPLVNKKKTPKRVRSVISIISTNMSHATVPFISGLHLFSRQHRFSRQLWPLHHTPIYILTILFEFQEHKKFMMKSATCFILISLIYCLLIVDSTILYKNKRDIVYPNDERLQKGKIRLFF